VQASIQVEEEGLSAYRRHGCWREYMPKIDRGIIMNVIYSKIAYKTISVVGW